MSDLRDIARDIRNARRAIDDLGRIFQVDPPRRGAEGEFWRMRRDSHRNEREWIGRERQQHRERYQTPPFTGGVNDGWQVNRFASEVAGVSVNLDAAAEALLGQIQTSQIAGVSVNGMRSRGLKQELYTNGHQVAAVITAEPTKGLGLFGQRNRNTTTALNHIVAGLTDADKTNDPASLVALQALGDARNVKMLDKTGITATSQLSNEAAADLEGVFNAAVRDGKISRAEMKVVNDAVEGRVTNTVEVSSRQQTPQAGMKYVEQDGRPRGSRGGDR